jgi:hypothetical protein
MLDYDDESRGTQREFGQMTDDMNERTSEKDESNP